MIPAENADDALLSCERERVDLVLTDVVMPHVSGRELADRLDKFQPGIEDCYARPDTLATSSTTTGFWNKTRTSSRSRSVRRSWPRRFAQFLDLRQMSRLPTRVPPIDAIIGVSHRCKSGTCNTRRL